MVAHQVHIRRWLWNLYCKWLEQLQTCSILTNICWNGWPNFIFKTMFFQTSNPDVSLSPCYHRKQVTSHQPRYNMIQQPCLQVSHWQTLALCRLDSSVQICNHRKAHVYRDFTYTYYKTMNVHTYTQCQYCYSNIGKLPINLQNSPIFPWVVDWFVEPKATAICG